MRLPHVPVERLQVELELPKVFRLELFDLQFEGDQAVQRPVEEEQVDRSPARRPGAGTGCR